MMWVCIAPLGLGASENEVSRHRSRPVAGLRALVHGHFVVDEVERILVGHIARRYHASIAAPRATTGASASAWW